MLAAYVGGQQATHELYGGSPQRTATLADTALHATSDACPGRMHALAAITVASAGLGRARLKREALRALERTNERLPADVTREQLALGAWPESACTTSTGTPPPTVPHPVSRTRVRRRAGTLLARRLRSRLQIALHQARRRDRARIGDQLAGPS